MTALTHAQRFAYGALLSAVESAVKSGQGTLALLLLDVGEVSELRARAGFEESDRVVAQLAEALAGAVREHDKVLRFGDASFGVLVNAVRNRGHAQLAAEKIFRIAQESIANVGMSMNPAVHVGIALHPHDAEDAAGLVQRAQLAAASARRRGESIRIYDDSCAEQVLRHWEMERELANALESGEIEMYFQPKVRIAGGVPAGAEALMRWLRDGQQVATPDVFVPVAENAGLIQPATALAINVALRHAAEWPQELGQLGVSVNVTPGMLRQRDLLDMVRSALSTWGVAPQRLTIEITEGALITDLDRTLATLRALRDLGIRVSIDDFGTGYSSLSYFKKIPADELKIDKSFVIGMLEDEADESIVRTIVGLAHRFKMAVTAEGVEDSATFAALGELGCEFAQGYLFAAPLSPAAYIDWLARSTRGQ